MPGQPARTQILPVALPDGSTVHVEIAQTGTGGDAAADQIPGIAAIRSDIAKWSQFLVETLTTAFADPPQRYALEFGIKLTVQSSKLISVLARASGEAAIRISLEWERPPVASTGHSDPPPRP